MIRKKNVLFYIPGLTQDAGGVRQYSAGLLNLFLDLHKDYNFFIYHDGNDDVIMNILKDNPEFTLIRSIDYTFTNKELAKEKIFWLYNRTKNLLIKKIGYNKDTILNKIIRINKIDIIHCPNQYIPNNASAKLITTLHDVQELHFPEFFTAEQRAYRAVHFKDYIERADKVIVSYNHVKEDLIKFFDKNPKDINVLLIKMNNLWFNKFKNIRFSKVQNVPEHFILYPANFWKHKNHERLIEAIKYIKIEKEIEIKLVLTGDYNFDHGIYIKDLIKKYNLDSQIEVLGIVDEITLYNLYKTSLGVVIPTLYEAGSFPLMESILLEVPVICSNTTSLPETIGDSEFIFNPLVVHDMADKIIKLWSQDDYRQRSVDNNKKQQGRLINTGAKEILSKIYSEMYE